MTFIRRVRGLLARGAYRMAEWLAAGKPPGGSAKPYSTAGWDHIPQGEYEYLPKGEFVFGPARDFLLIPKNRYRLHRLPGQGTLDGQGVGWLTEDNTPAAYDRLWGSDEALSAFRSESGHIRSVLTTEIVDLLGPDLGRVSDVVDIGCGAGDLLLELRRRCSRVSTAGLDFSEAAIERARLAIPEGDFRQFSIVDTLPYESARFDVVFCTDVLEHLEYPRETIGELIRICRPGGRVVLVVPDGDVDQFFGHLWFWSLASWQQMFSGLDARTGYLPESRELYAIITREGSAAGSSRAQ